MELRVQLQKEGGSAEKAPCQQRPNCSADTASCSQEAAELSGAAIRAGGAAKLPGWLGSSPGNSAVTL